jgi:hypothetical protein
MHATLSVIVEVGLQLQPLTIMLQRHQATLDQFLLAHWSHALGIVGRRGFTRDETATLAQLGEVGALVQAALTDNPLCAWIDDGQNGGQHWLQRQPVGDVMWFRVLRDGGVPSLRKIIDAFVSLFPTTES